MDAPSKGRKVVIGGSGGRPSAPAHAAPSLPNSPRNKKTVAAAPAAAAVTTAAATSSSSPKKPSAPSTASTSGSTSPRNKKAAPPSSMAIASSSSLTTPNSKGTSKSPSPTPSTQPSRRGSAGGGAGVMVGSSAVLLGRDLLKGAFIVDAKPKEHAPLKKHLRAAASVPIHSPKAKLDAKRGKDKAAKDNKATAAADASAAAAAAAAAEQAAAEQAAAEQAAAEAAEAARVEAEVAAAAEAAAEALRKAKRLAAELAAREAEAAAAAAAAAAEVQARKEAATAAKKAHDDEERVKRQSKHSTTPSTKSKRGSKASSHAPSPATSQAASRTHVKIPSVSSLPAIAAATAALPAASVVSPKSDRQTNEQRKNASSKGLTTKSRSDAGAKKFAPILSSSPVATPALAQPVASTPVASSLTKEEVEEDALDEVDEEVIIPEPAEEKSAVHSTSIPSPTSSASITATAAPSPTTTPAPAPRKPPKSLLQQPSTFHFSSPAAASSSSATHASPSNSASLAAEHRTERDARLAAEFAEREAEVAAAMAAAAVDKERRARERERERETEKEREIAAARKKEKKDDAPLQTTHQQQQQRKKQQQQREIEIKEDDRDTFSDSESPIQHPKRRKKKQTSTAIALLDDAASDVSEHSTPVKRSRKKKSRASNALDDASSAAPSTTGAPPALLSPLSMATLASLSSTQQNMLKGGGPGAPGTGGIMQDLLLEYFESRGMRRTAASFQQEQGGETLRGTTPSGSVTPLVTPRKPAQKVQPPPGGLHSSPQLKKLNAAARLRRAFDTGDRVAFFAHLTTEAPEAIKALKRDTKGESLLFWLHLYFAIYPLHPSAPRRAEGAGAGGQTPQEDASKAMGEFQRYLSSASAATSDPAVLPYFGLPYIGDPRSHATFAHLFEPAWMTDMQSRAEKLVNTHLHGGQRSTMGGVGGTETPTPRRSQATRLEKIVLGAVNGDSTTTSPQVVSPPPPASEKPRKKRLVRRPLILTPNRSRATSPGGATPSGNSPQQDPLNAPPGSVSAPFSTLSRGVASPPLAKSRLDRNAPPAGISVDDVSRKDLHDALGMASKLSNLLNLLQMDIGSNADALSDAELQDLQAKLQNLASKSVVLQKPSKEPLPPPSLMQTTSPSPAPQNEGGFVRSASSAALRRLLAEGPAAAAASSTSPDEPSFFAWPSLDFPRIRDTLRRGSPNERSTLLQALRWRLTRSTPAVRKRHLALYVQHDLLQCASAAKDGSVSANGGSLLHSLSSGTDAPTQEQTARLVNVMSSYGSGRRYLLHHPGLIALLFGILRAPGSAAVNGGGEDTPSRQHALGSLQKFSLSRRAQSTMISLGVMEWSAACVLSHAALEAPSRRISDYSLEYGTALLMNLSLRTAGKLRCERVHELSRSGRITASASSDILGSLVACVRMEELQFRTYINGTIYSLLSRRRIRARARELQLAALLISVRPQVDLRVQQQFDYILRLLSSHEESDLLAEAEGDAPDEDTMLSDDEDDGEGEHESKESVLEGASSVAMPEDDEDEEVAEADDDEATAAAASTKQGAHAGESFLQSFYSLIAQEESTPYPTLPVHHSRLASLHAPLSGVPYPLAASPINPALAPLALSPSPSGSPALPTLNTDLESLSPNATPRTSSPSLPGSSAYFAGHERGHSLARGSNGGAFPILKPTTPSNKGRPSLPLSGAITNSVNSVVTGSNQGSFAPSSRGMTSVRAVNVQPQPPRFSSPQPQAAQQNRARPLGKSPSAPVLEPVISPPAVIAHLSPPAARPVAVSPVSVPPLALGLADRRIPPPSVNAADPTEKESLTRYYKAFASRAKVGRTPISSAFAEPGEFDR